MSRLRFLSSTVLVVLASTVLPGLAASQNPPIDLSGRWSFSVVTENGTGTPTVTLRQRGDTLSGTYESTRMGVRALEGIVNGREFSFTVKGSDEGSVSLIFRGHVESDGRLTGTADFSGQGSATFTGQRHK